MFHVVVFNVTSREVVHSFEFRFLPVNRNSSLSPSLPHSRVVQVDPTFYPPSPNNHLTISQSQAAQEILAGR